MSRTAEAYDPTSGLDLNPIPIEEKLNKEYIESKPHYVFWFGNEPLTIHQVRCKKTRLRPGVIEQINNYKYPDRRQAGGDNADYNEGEPVPNAMVVNAQGQMSLVDNKESVFRTARAGVICSDLELLFGNTRGDDEKVGSGLVVLRCLVDVPGNVIADIGKTLVPTPLEPDPDDPRKSRVKSAEDFRKMITSGREQYAAEVNTPEFKKAQRDTADLMLQAVDEGEVHITSHLDSVRSETEKRKLADGRGRPGFTKKEKAAMRLVGKRLSDYENDTRSAQNQLAEQVVSILQAQPAAQGLSAETLANAFEIVFRRLGVGGQTPPSQAPPAQPAKPSTPQQSK